ncbi:branched-chain alpha-keto acid dehydrogenase subunit E2 [candidate division KSB3 bacterium]|uniref:Dihydrolipoamide acetyltransferase component of pyruvate dehydrogenase complex n=1 Tax=candidate division KSB3 bacterium TaxID=2044937 RepID=A0A9D5JZZ1_9BACT|nr:branched-chain alpha-keto acid dehydrogenase subunit E2 [candidate division KSB3 bacterium]MBD3327407.1 branched-chain alpha-keto acid dehydrogenase subunit E2 [candidate division KSB3 bacterium]
MKKEIRLPEIAENVETATVTKVLVAEGDSIEQEQSIVEMESEKAAFEVPSPENGTIQDIKISEGDEVQVGDVLMTVETEKDTSEQDEPEAKSEEAVSEEQKAEEQETRETPPPKEQPAAEAKEEEKAEPPKQRKEVPAAPSVRRLARELGVAIYQVEGSGPGGRILAEDVKAQAKKIVSEKPSAESAPEGVELPDFSQWGHVERQSMSNIRTVIARNMTQAWRTIPHVHQFDQCDITDLEQFRQQHKRTVEQAGGKLTITAILLKIVSAALQRFPRFNASLDMAAKEIIYKDYIHIGVAVDTDRGLLVPVIRDVNHKPIIALAVELVEMAEKARDKKLKPDAMQGGNFSISNLGGIGGTNFTPIVYPPQVAVLGVARASMQPVYQDNDFTPRLILPLSLSYDHRVIDGAEGARFLRWICQALEQPLTIFLDV